MGVSIISEKLEDIRNYLDVEVHPVVSPDRWDVYCTLCDMVDDIITLLKAQEPVKPKKLMAKVKNGYRWRFYCGKCGDEIDRLDKYCRHCGRTVKW